MKIPTFYWLTSGKERQGNFGDILTPYILDYFQIPYSYTKTWKDPDIKIDAIAVGSIIERAAYKNTVVLGSGIMTNHKKLNPNADYRLVRGPLSRERILKAGGTCPKNYGDPGLILPLIFPENEKVHDVGFIPHLVDYSEIKNQYPDKLIINLQTTDPAKIISQITSCKKIVSSSLHGIITAHAYNIPAAWAFSHKLIGNWGDTKFLDYYYSIGKSPKMSSFECPEFDTADFSIDNIVDTFETYSYEIRNS